MVLFANKVVPSGGTPSGGTAAARGAILIYGFLWYIYFIEEVFLMRRRIMSLFLLLALCVGMAVPAMADTVDSTWNGDFSTQIGRAHV